MGEDGTPQQQDANECLTELLRVLQQKLPKVEGAAVANNKRSTVIEQYFFGEFSVTMKNDETEEGWFAYIFLIYLSHPNIHCPF